jgi:hypothetical protein
MTLAGITPLPVVQLLQIIVRSTVKHLGNILQTWKDPSQPTGKKLQAFETWSFGFQNTTYLWLGQLPLLSTQLPPLHKRGSTSFFTPYVYFMHGCAEYVRGRSPREKFGNRCKSNKAFFWKNEPGSFFKQNHSYFKSLILMQKRATQIWSQYLYEKLKRKKAICIEIKVPKRVRSFSA